MNKQTKTTLVSTSPTTTAPPHVIYPTETPFPIHI